MWPDKKKGKIMYVPPLVLRELDLISKEDNIMKKSKAFEKMVEHTRIGREIEKINLFKKKKASARDIPIIAALIFMFAIGFFIAHFAINSISSEMLSNDVINSSSAANQTISAGMEVTSQFDYVIFMVFIGLCIALIISAWFIGGNPIFMIIYFIIVAVSVALSAIMANIWEDVSQMSVFGLTLNAFPISNNLMLNLPIYMTVIGFLGLTIMFAKPYIVGSQ